LAGYVVDCRFGKFCVDAMTDIVLLASGASSVGSCYLAVTNLDLSTNVCINAEKSKYTSSCFPQKVVQWWCVFCFIQ